MIVYVDNLSHCHTAKPDGEYTLVETVFFDGKCKEYVEGHCFEIQENGYAVYAWKDYPELAAAQAQYEADLAAAAEAYREGVNSAYDQ